MKQQEKAHTETSHDDTPKGNETPFFARFLESQYDAAETGAERDEAIFTTLKYPSDRDEIDRPLAHL
ncbi:MAG TPA: microviridin/marinostatin family tricyclic proteinase inhibitor [Pyrinomonadaceae bacterium]|jgi:hypothetical protein